MADPSVLDVYRREITPELYTEIREVVIRFPWGQERRLFRGEKVYVSGIEIPEIA